MQSLRPLFHYNGCYRFIGRAAAIAYAGECARIHRAAFTPSGARGWSEAEIIDLLRRDTALLLTTPGGFLLADIIADEAEIIAIAVHPTEQRHGIGRALLSRFVEACDHRDIRRALLEVAVDNHAAIALYGSFAFKEIGIRPNYFNHGDTHVSASVMERVFATA